MCCKIVIVENLQNLRKINHKSLELLCPPQSNKNPAAQAKAL
jgi:hypothetical protein